MGMNIPFAFPDWVPWWVPMVLLVPALLYALAFLFMPFSVLGVKTRLEVIEARLDEIQQEIRHLALRLPAGHYGGVRRAVADGCLVITLQKAGLNRG